MTEATITTSFKKCLLAELGKSVRLVTDCGHPAKLDDTESKNGFTGRVLAFGAWVPASWDAFGKCYATPNFNLRFAIC